MEIARNPDARLRDLSAAAGLTERTAQAGHRVGPFLALLSASGHALGGEPGPR